ncbi:hypothetical protein PF006_g23081 [Phytophthora fragariae]|uniref:Uncharacterized protein n=2 Tax=Phytophthora fragariae TaxID=53985 RepID=A0A6A3RP27_9STRA|nr:hypothetical protein PF006_g23081 [Phytophthora fragariae]
MVDIMFQREQKKLVKYLVAALVAATFKAEVQRRIDQEQNKKYKGNVIEFSRCCWRTFLCNFSSGRQFSIKGILTRDKNAERNAELVRDRLLSAIEDASKNGLRGEALNRLKASLK